MRRLSFSSICLISLVAACTQFPELDAATEPQTREAQYLPFLPLDELLAHTQPVLTTDAPDLVAARVAALKARADILRRPVISQADRARLSIPR